MTNSSSWGNYKNTSMTYTGRKATASHNGSNWIIQPFGTKTTNGKKGTYANNVRGGELLTTGASATTEKYHIFDIAGNIGEWTEEDSHYATSGQYRVIRGDSLIHTSDDTSACYRGYNAVSSTGIAVGFRVVICIK